MNECQPSLKQLRAETLNAVSSPGGVVCSAPAGGIGASKYAHSGRCNLNMTLEKYTVGVGDRFAHQAEAQLQACVQLAADGIEVVPVWNKSNREHSFIGSEPQSVYDAAKAAVEALGWEQGWHVDADHINMDTVDKYLDCSDFFTIDVADFIGQTPGGDAVAVFVG